MKIYKNIKTIKAADVDISDRQRKDVGDLKALANSLEAIGQIHPILMDGDKLLAGGRRTLACLLLSSQGRAIHGLEVGEINCINTKDDLEPLEQLLIELEENKQRKGFNKAEEALTIAAIKVKMEEAEERGVSNRSLAKALGYSTTHVSMALQVADAVSNKGMEELKNESSVFGAYRKLQTAKKLEEIMERVAEKEAEDPTQVVDYSDRLYCGDATEWIQTIEDESIDFIIFDPPWGIGIDSYDRHHNYGTFDDNAETGIQITKRLIPELYRVLKTDTYAVIWFGIQYYQFLTDMLEESGFKVHPVPFVWHKTDKAGSQNDPSKTTINVWEPAFLVQKGDPRIFAQGRSNLLAYPMVRSGRIHYAQKNVDMLVDIMERFSIGSMTVLDPTFGSGSTFIAAKRLGRHFVGCEFDPENYRKALDWLRMT